jgi:hypothetical protein
MVQQRDHVKLSKVRQLVDQMGYSHFDAVAAVVKGLQRSASVADNSISFGALLETSGATRHHQR